MKLIVCDSYDEMSKKAAEIVSDVINENPSAILGLATGSTPEGMYKELVEAYKDGKLDFSKVSTVNLDEYVGIDPSNPQSYQSFMNENLFDRVNINKENTHLPKEIGSLEESVKAYDKLLAEIGQRDLQLLGIGPNGHIAFNEPDEKLNMHTSIIDLKDETIEANSRFFDSKDDVPKQAMSMGMADIFNSKTLLVLASGKNKHKAVEKFMHTDKIETLFPMSFINLHPNCYLIVDKDAYQG
ncbi:MAG: glucosamine-6-phosphate deaminase [Peptoniphilaceae bacterium]|nr:glucosamine-6-phosphate deaminase [Peptoniphilaceae bacterium]MDY6018553.1 glucosamine-6-phosphate deaminase [Anaerococcus sp.]